MLIDSTKLIAGSGIQICSNDEIDYVVTDKPDQPLLKKIFRDKLL
jgi:DeoR/GlpR family transcriptional regulator of sugar metabolism